MKVTLSKMTFGFPAYKTEIMEVSLTVVEIPENNQV